MIDIGEFREFAGKVRVEGTSLPSVRFTTSADPIAATDARTVSFVFSDESVDRYGDIIQARGWDLANFNANPVALFGHDAGSVENVVGRAKNVRVKGTELIGDIEFMGADVNPNAEAVYQMVKGGFLKTVSVGFAPIEWKATKDKARPGGVDFIKQELLEISIVPIPANPNALVQARAAGIEVDRLGLTAAIEEPDVVVELAPAVASNRVLAREYRKRGLYELSSLCDLLSYADYVCRCVEAEAEDEADGSEVPGRMRSWINEGNAIIAAMAAEETEENISGSQGRDIAGEAARGVREALAAAGLFRAGKVLSKESRATITTAHGHAQSAVDTLSSMLDEPADENSEDNANNPGVEPVDFDSEGRALRARKARALAAKSKYEI